MKQSRDVVDRRRQKILEMVKRCGDIKVNDIAQKLQVSLLTIRRDLQYLEDNRLLERYYGGARVDKDEELRKIKDKMQFDRDAIARYAASLVEDGDCIFVNGSQTALDMIPYIKANDVTVITNNGNAVNIEDVPNVSICLTGGELREAKGVMGGTIALNSLMKVTAKKGFLGCSGLSVKNGMTTDFLSEVQINESMIEKIAGNTYLLADHTKLGKDSSFISCPIEKITHIITDKDAPEETIREFQDQEIEVIQTE